MTPLRLAFMGTPDFALPTLEALARAGHEIAAVYSQPARPAGRGKQLQATPVARLAEACGWPLHTPLSLRGADEIAAFQAMKLDAAIVVAYGLMLPPEILAAPRWGCLNLHASLLPRWRGAAPIQRAIEAGDAESGVAIMQMDQGLDTGAVLAEARVPITATTTGARLHDALSVLGAGLLVETLAALVEGRVTSTAQPTSGVTYARKLTRAESAIDWRRPAVEIERRLRAFTPWPGCHFLLAGQRVKLLRATAVAGHGAAGEVLDDQLTVACGEGALRLLEVQREGRQAVAVADFLRGQPVAKGTHLG